MKGLGRRTPPDFEHIAKYPLRAAPPVPKPVPVVLGVNWYASFDRPERDARGRYWIGRDKHNLGPIRGGHAICVKPTSLRDPLSWYRFYDQGSEGACVGFAASRMMTLLNRQRYDAQWLYRQAQLFDTWSDTPPGEGTSVRAAMDILRDRGHRRVWRGESRPTESGAGIAANRWATTVDEIRSVLQSPHHDKLDAVPLLNSWGDDYPHLVWLPYPTLQRLLDEDGEATLVTDR